MAKRKKSGGYLGFSYLVSVLLAIFPITNIILGIVTRVKRDNILYAVLNFFLFFIFYFVDLITMIAYGKITFLN